MRLKIMAGQLRQAVAGIWPSVGTYIHDERKYYKAVLLKAENKKLTLSAESRVMFSRSEVEVDIEEEGTVAVPGGLLRDIAKSVDEDSVFDIEYEGGDVYVVKFINGTDRWEVNSVNQDTVKPFEIPEDSTYKFDLPAFRSMINESAPAVGRSDVGDFQSRYEFGAIEIKREIYEDEKLDVIRAATTDGHRIHLIEADIVKAINVGTGDFDALDNRGVLVSKEITRALSSLPEDAEEVEVSFGMNKSYMILKAGGVTHGVRLLSGQFPPYEKIIERVNPVGSVKTNRVEFTKAVRSARIVKKDTIEISIEGETMFPLVVSATNKDPDHKKAETSYREIEGVCDGEKFKTKINPTYMLASLSAIPDADEVELIYSGDNMPIVVKHPSRYFRSFIMPLEGG